ncbi:MAG: hydrogenase formation protein HypD [Microbacterium sp.]|uniref:Hydrogenase expression/formation protein HypD n=1 Tax=Microbacterium ginsengisoli TaxID=400772 RepID=A0A0F0LVE5_9MICO|nr:MULTISPECIES: hydrogenase formation protein HypD [Microbacterium]MAL06564.1 hydrogenase formation protein HypD [Microbacterium sp.]KJL36265.1 Hydrogenase expression/formation protein HypD [Microbacterium ginsengisoli]MBN9208274.1 hydrogenase formation protein HypD [Microbacterium ginsengisoli]ODU73003.1 MAG: hydrogenase formation protein HypD [Microbacterium sp. SCN 71-21]HAN23847.1 hydrogenase formation protein HypD [Microbacterium ginsengisoli]
MRFVDEFRDPAAARSLLTVIEGQAERLGRPLSFMEVCGGHTHTIYRHGLEHLLPESIQLVHGPGCPVCVIPMGRVDDAVWLAHRPGVIFTTFGDMMRVPGTEGSLLQAQASGADVRFVYSPLDALKIAIDNPDKEVVFFAVGFETTAPSTAVTIARAAALDVRNFSIFCNHVLIEPPLRAILDSADLELDGFIGPGHVSTVVGTEIFRFIPEDYGLPIVVTGFEPLDILQSIEMLLAQYESGRCEVENQYARVVRPEGNPAALALMRQVFAVRETFEWRGLGYIPRSGYGIHPDYARFDAEQKFAMPGVRVADPPACECGSVLRGVIKPWQCKVFGTACTPETPIGTCMVSPEGACAAYYNFGRLHREAAQAVARA